MRKAVLIAACVATLGGQAMAGFVVVKDRDPRPGRQRPFGAVELKADERGVFKTAEGSSFVRVNGRFIDCIDRSGPEECTKVRRRALREAERDSDRSDFDRQSSSSGSGSSSSSSSSGSGRR